MRALRRPATYHDAHGPVAEVRVIALLFVLVIGLSRVYLGVHWPTDVLGGFVAGACCVLIGDALLELPAGHAETTRA